MTGRRVLVVCLSLALLVLVLRNVQIAPEADAPEPSSESDAPASPELGDRARELVRAIEGPSDGAWVGVRPGQHGENPELPEQLAALGYLDGVEDAPERTSVTVYDAERSWNGLNLYVAGHAQEAILMDMRGRVLHRWRFDYEVLRQPLGEDYEKLLKQLGRNASRFIPSFFRDAHVFPNGDLLALYDNTVLVKLDRDSKLLWVYDRRPHHDVFVAETGEIYVLTNDLRAVPSLHPTRRFLDNSIVKLDADGHEIARVSILDALRAGGRERIMADLVALVPVIFGGRDILHTNTVELVDDRFASRLPTVRAGNVLISLPHVHSAVVVDLESERAVWDFRGKFRYQHDPRVLGNGNLLLFDNQRGPDEQSVVSEFDPVTGEEVWAYRGTTQKPFYSWCCGRNARLPNGNTLIVETQAGRALEVTPAGETVWEFVNPHRAGEKGDLIAQLFGVERLPQDFPLEWLPESRPASDQ